MVSLLITLLVLGLVCYLAYWILGMLPIPAPIKNVVFIVLGIIILIYLLETLLGGGTGLGLSLR